MQDQAEPQLSHMSWARFLGTAALWAGRQSWRKNDLPLVQKKGLCTLSRYKAKKSYDALVHWVGMEGLSCMTLVCGDVLTLGDRALIKHLHD